MINTKCDNARILIQYHTLSERDPPFFSHKYVKDEGVDLLTKLNRPFIDFSHISLFPRFQKEIGKKKKKSVTEHFEHIIH